MKVGVVGFHNLYHKHNNSNSRSDQISGADVNINAPIKSDLFKKSPTTFGSKASLLSFENMSHLKIPCLCCGKPMITKREWSGFLTRWPQLNESFSSDYVIKTFTNSHLYPHERKIFNILQQLNKKNPNTKFCDLLDNIASPPKRFKIFAEAKRKLTPLEFNSRVINLLEDYEDKMRPVEKQVFSKLKDLHKLNREKSLSDLIFLMRPEHLKKLEIVQFKILDDINILAKNLPLESRQKIKDFTKATRNIIIDEFDEDPFKRRIFLKKINDLAATLPKSETITKILDKASTMPNSFDNESAFIVKYSGKTLRNKIKDGNKIYERRSSKEIGKRLLSTAVVSIEHVFPTNPVKGRPKGSDDPKKLVLECAGCNNPRASIEGYKWAKMHPEIIKNSQKQIDIIIDHINNGRIKNYEWYPSEIGKTLETEFTDIQTGEVLIKIDTSKLKKKSQVNLNKLKDKFILKPA